MIDEFLTILMKVLPLNENIQADFLPKLKTIKVSKGKILLSEGEICDKLWFVKSGLARGYYSMDSSKHEYQDITDWFAIERNFFFAAQSFIEQVPSSESIELLEDSELIYMYRHDLYQLYTQYPEVCKLGRIMAERYWLLQKERLRDMRLHTAQERLEIFQKKSRRLFLRVHQKHIASYLGISENYVSKLKAKR